MKRPRVKFLAWCVYQALEAIGAQWKYNERRRRNLPQVLAGNAGLVTVETR